MENDLRGVRSMNMTCFESKIASNSNYCRALNYKAQTGCEDPYGWECSSGRI